MSWLFIAGGPPMWFLVILGLVALVAAVRFALSPDARRVSTVVALSVATACSMGGGVVSDLAAVSRHVPGDPELSKPENFATVLLIGFGESMAPAILGFTLLSLVWLVMAVGFRRLGTRQAV